MRNHLYGAVAGVDYRDAAGRATHVQLDFAFAGDDLARDHLFLLIHAASETDRACAAFDFKFAHLLTMGLCTVTSFVPSGNDASTCTSAIISATPSITSSRDSSVVPWLKNSATVLPSRAPSSIAAER